MPARTPKSGYGWGDDGAPSRRDASWRRAKARKIIEVVSEARDMAGVRLLDIGVGPGVITGVLAEAVGSHGQTWGVDVADERQVRTGFDFKLLTDPTLPFDDGSFDIVVSNHVVEHVGDLASQLAHLSEIRRVLTTDGVCYLATPSRWAPIEPHYKLPLLSWLPARMRSPYLRLIRRGSTYDCTPLGYADLRRLFRRARLRHVDRTGHAMRAMARIEGRGGLTGRLLRAPEWLLAGARPLIPTMVFLLQKERDNASGRRPLQGDSG